MGEDDNAPGISAIEELGGAPPVRRVSPGGRELLLGLALLLGILGWAGWDWFQQQSGRDRYQAGLRAAELRDWDAALAHYRAAGDYGNARAYATEAEQLVGLREWHYENALEAMKRKQWQLALVATRQVTQIQPGYRNTERMKAWATRQVYPLALADAVVLRPEAQPPGLYIYSAGSWIWLEGSDARSRVQGSGDLCCIVYDGPWMGAAQGQAAGGSVEPGRSLYLARRDGKGLSFTRLALPPDGYDWFYWGKAGVWAMRYGPDEAGRQGPPDRTYHTRGLGAGGFMYQAFDSPAIAPIRSLGEKSLVMDLGPDGSHVLIADAGYIIGGEHVTKLFIADGIGEKPLALISHPGMPYRARLSPDGHHVLYIARIGSGTRARQVVLLLAAAGGTPPRTLLETAADDSAEETQPGAAFLKAGEAPMVALATRSRGGGGELSLFAPVRLPLGPRPMLGGELGLDHVWVTQGRETDGALLGWSGWLDHALLYLDHTGKNSLVRPQLDSSEEPGMAVMAGGYILYESMRHAAGGPETTTLNALPLSSIHQAFPPRTELFSTTSATGDSWALGPAMAAYLEDGRLWARGYDGSPALLLEQGVTAIYDLRRYERVDWLR